jgi:DNA gyrase subunit A
VIVRMQADAIPQQSRAATGVRLQRLDAGDRLAEVVLVPPAPEETEEASETAADAVQPSAGTAAAIVADGAAPDPADAAD